MQAIPSIDLCKTNPQRALRMAARTFSVLAVQHNKHRNLPAAADYAARHKICLDALHELLKEGEITCVS